MFGCCGSESQKFKDENGKVDPERLACICKQIDLDESNKEQAQLLKERVSQCDCPCHVDGCVVLC